MADERVPVGPVDIQDILDRLMRLPISSWRYRWEDDAIRHLGPSAGDFREAFLLDSDDRMVNPNDATGVVMVSLQALNERLEALRALIALLETQQAERAAADLASARTGIGGSENVSE